MTNVKLMCSNRKVNYSSGMTTNAYNLNLDTFNKLYNLKVYGYQITVDGLKEHHDKQRVKADGSGTYDVIIKNLLSIKNSSKYKMARITIRVNVTEDISDKMGDFVKFYESNFGNDDRFTLRFAITGNYGGAEIEKFSNKLMKPKDIFEKLSTEKVYDNENINLADSIRFFNPMNLTCYAAQKNSLTIGSDLTIYKCTIHFNQEVNHIGKITINGDTEIDEHLHNCWYIKKDDVNDRCKTCFYYPCCYNASCPLKSNFDIFDDVCTSGHLKNNLSKHLISLSKRMAFKTIDFI